MEQLFKKETNDYKEIYPFNFIQNLNDITSDKSLPQILSTFNNIFLPYQNNAEDTRNLIPILLRRKGLWITYNNGDKYLTEYYKGDASDIQLNWGKDYNWEIVPDVKYVQTEASKLPNGIITPDKLSPALQELIKQNNNITNLPDDEDLEERNGVISFKDRIYNPYLSTGKGYKILRMNWVNGRNILTQDMINEENTIYEIRYDFDLNGATITVPENCILKFNGGTLVNGKLIGDKTYISANQCVIFNNIKIDGNFLNKIVYTLWFGDDMNEINECIKIAPIVEFTKNKLYEYDLKSIKPISHSSLRGNNCILKINNSNTGYYQILHIDSIEDVEICDFSIIGDAKYNQSAGEWGHGIVVDNSKNIRLSNIKVSYCFGDGFYIVGTSENIVIDNCIADNNRRQGCSIIEGKRIHIRNSVFSNTGKNYYTASGAGINVEPNKEIEICEVFIENCNFFNNYDGKDLTVSNLSKTISSKVLVKDCTMSDNIVFTTSNNTTIINSIFRSLIIDWSHNISVLSSKFENMAMKSNEHSETETYLDNVYDIIIRNCSLVSDTNAITAGILYADIYNVLIDDCYISSTKDVFHLFDAQNISGGVFRDLVIRNTTISSNSQTYLECGRYESCSFNITNSLRLNKRHGVLQIFNSVLNATEVRTYQIDDKAIPIEFIGNIVKTLGENAIVNGLGTSIKIMYANNIFVSASNGGKALMRRTLDIIDMTEDISISTPFAPSTTLVGYSYFDTTLNKPLYWTGKKWVDANGTDV